MNNIVEKLTTEERKPSPLCDEINIFQSTGDYVALAKRKVIPRPLLSNNELFPIDDPQDVIDSFGTAISQDGRYSFLSRDPD